MSKSSYSLSVAAGAGPGQSPAPSPVVLRKDGLAGHERSHSDTPPVPVGRRN